MLKLSESKENLIVMNGAGLFRNGKWLVRGVDLSVDRGEIVSVIGPNGSGKSTTLKMALGIEVPSEGMAEQKANLRVGYVPQEFTIDWTLPLTVGRLVNLTEKVGKEQTIEVLEKMEIAHLIESPVQKISSGEFQRALLARAVSRKPDLLVLDEPVQGLDYSSEIKFYGLISELRSELNYGILLISHDLHLVMAATDRVICLNGHVCCQGAPKSVARNPEFMKLFGDFSDALGIYTHDHDHTHLPDGRIQLSGESDQESEQ